MENSSARGGNSGLPSKAGINGFDIHDRKIHLDSKISKGGAHAKDQRA
jgi:hypothetical protein